MIDSFRRDKALDPNKDQLLIFKLFLGFSSWVDYPYTASTCDDSAAIYIIVVKI
jgi:hypothetical protein